MKKLVTALLLFILSLLPLLFPTTSYAGTCTNTADYENRIIDCAGRYDDTTCRETPTKYYKHAVVTYIFGVESCTREEHVTDRSDCTVISPACRGFTCNDNGDSDPWTVDCGTSGICLPPGYTTAQACAGTACVATGGGCIQVNNCSHSNCVSNACTTVLENASCTTYAACQITNSSAAGYCAAASAPAPAPAPTTAPAPPAGSCTVTDQYLAGIAGATCNSTLTTSTGTCPCGYTFNFNYVPAGTCNKIGGGQGQVYAEGTLTCTAPPTPNCNSGIDCDTCFGASTNTCSAGNGSQSCTYTSHSSGVDCTQVAAPSQACTINNCSSGLRCEWGSCVALRPWIQVTGNIHSNTKIDLPGPYGR